MNTSLTRLDLLVAAAAGPALPLGTPSSRSPSPATPGIDPTARLDAIVRVIGRSGGGIAVRWTDGVLSATVGAEATPLFRVPSQIHTRPRPGANMTGGHGRVLGP